MTNNKNNIPIYAEEQIINEKTINIQEILNRKEFKQPISSNFIKLKIEEGNYMCSTKWKDKPNYERYGFYLEEEEEKWVQIDIPHNLVEKLEIEKGDDITYPLYLTIDISQKKLIRGAYTIENEEEVFIDKPVSEKNVEKELVKRLEELEKLREQVKELEDLKSEKNDLKEKVNNLEGTIQEKDEEISEKEGQVNYQKELIEKETKAKEKLQKELEGTKNKKRDWKNFHDWLENNIIEVYIDEKGLGRYRVKNEKENIYKVLAGLEKTVDGSADNYNGKRSLGLFMGLLKGKLGIPIQNNIIEDISSWYKYSRFLFEYDEAAEKIEDLVDKKISAINLENYFFEPKILKDFNTLFKSWKNAAPLQTTT